MPLTQAPKDITVCYLQVVVMPNGEIICLGKTVGWVKELGRYLTKVDVGSDIHANSR